MPKKFNNQSFSSLRWQNGVLTVLDQRLLPHDEIYIEIKDVRQTAAAIHNMVVRGAPLIGITAAYGMALAICRLEDASLEDAQSILEDAAQTLADSRPTAVNLHWALDRMLAAAKAPGILNFADLKDRLIDEANAIASEDIRTNLLIAQNAFPLVPQGARIIHHCNTGGLATMDYGTALGIIRFAHENGKEIFVYVDETRPRLQGARLTAWELTKLGISHTVIVDGASGFVMQQKKIDLVTVGCDRVALNGDTANKIGTYNLAIVAKAHGVPFYVAAPTSTIDPMIKSGQDISIEEREAGEIKQFGSETITPESSTVFNPSFDITPAIYITAIITEAGIAYPPYENSLSEMIKKAHTIHKGARNK